MKSNLMIKKVCFDLRWAIKCIFFKFRFETKIIYPNLIWNNLVWSVLKIINVLYDIKKNSIWIFPFWWWVQNDKNRAEYTLPPAYTVCIVRSLVLCFKFRASHKSMEGGFLASLLYLFQRLSRCRFCHTQKVHSRLATKNYKLW